MQMSPLHPAAATRSSPGTAVYRNTETCTQELTKPVSDSAHGCRSMQPAVRYLSYVTRYSNMHWPARRAGSRVGQDCSNAVSLALPEPEGLVHASIPCCWPKELQFCGVLILEARIEALQHVSHRSNST